MLTNRHKLCFNVPHASVPKMGIAMHLYLCVSIQLYVVLYSVLLVTANTNDFDYVSPVVGVLSQPYLDPNSTNLTTFEIPASYVKWLESGGARAVAIPYDAPDDLVDALYDQVNGILFPGGESRLPASAKRLYEKAVAEKHFPIWGSCLGFEYLLSLASEEGEAVLQSNFDAENISLPLELIMEDAPPKLYRPRWLQHIVTSENVTTNFHHQGLEPDKFYNDSSLVKMFRVTAISNDRNGRPFVSTIESIHDAYPFFGTQFHPEKNLFEYGFHRDGYNIPYQHINHSPHALKVSQYMAQFFVNLVREKMQLQQRNSGKHRYTDPDKYPLVYDYEMKRGTNFEQTYIIPGYQTSVKENKNLQSADGFKSLTLASRRLRMYA